VNHGVAQDAGIVDQNVDRAEPSQGSLDDRFSALKSADRVGIGRGLPSFVKDSTNTSAAAASSISLTTTRAPSRAILKAIARPIPLPAPVTTATFASSRICSPPAPSGFCQSLRGHEARAG
jgi:hypothetical protein